MITADQLKDIKERTKKRADALQNEALALLSKAKELLGWEAEYDMVDMCRDADRWQTMNPSGYDA